MLGILIVRFVQKALFLSLWQKSPKVHESPKKFGTQAVSRRYALPTMSTLKNCSLCNQDLSVEFFNKKPTSKDGLTSRCKICLKNVKPESKAVETVPTVIPPSQRTVTLRDGTVVPYLNSQQENLDLIDEMWAERRKMFAKMDDFLAITLAGIPKWRQE